MEVLNIAIIDDDQTKITRIKSQFSKRHDIEQDSKSFDYELNLIPLDIKRVRDDLKQMLFQNHCDAIIIDYNLTSYSSIVKNGIEIANIIQETKELFPLFILTAYEDSLFSKEIFSAHQIYNSSYYLNNIDYRKEFHMRLIEQILMTRKQRKKWEEEINELLPQAGKSVEIDSRILELDSLIENSIDKTCAINPKLKEEVSNNNLIKLLNRIDEIINE